MPASGCLEGGWQRPELSGGPEVSASRAPWGRHPGPFPDTALPDGVRTPRSELASDGPGGTTVPRVEEEPSPGIGGGSITFSETPRRQRPVGISRRKTAFSLTFSFRPNSLFPGGTSASEPCFGENNFISGCRLYDGPGWPVTGEHSTLRTHCHCHPAGDSPVIVCSHASLG